ncbi:Zinc finger, PHD-type [Corchorus olitorius]|uniref:Zinc finger, PHD-type n=1 Tax=Corchorus olitorius TaxID=93759 RepID=A0A1R3HEG3_9ROSI|nr:Zinc finger, PHD-type [Corchorus olitorius]
MDLKHVSHEHPLQVWNHGSDQHAEGVCCFASEEGVEGRPSYGCSCGCKFYLHKTCAELELAPEINHPFHPHHPLVLLPKSPYAGKFNCKFCRGAFSGLVYHCDSCKFDLDINCAASTSNIAGNLFESCSLHEHPLLFINNDKHFKGALGDCFACMEKVSTPFYMCFDCNEFYLHKECAELPLQIDNHPFHPQHPLFLSNYLLPGLESLQGNHGDGLFCAFCRGFFKIGDFRYVYRCHSCSTFQLHIDCALLLLQQLSVAPKLEHSVHQHPLIFIDEKHGRIFHDECLGCRKTLSGPIYRCLELGCQDVYLHKECAELPLEINHPRDRKHPLTLLQNPPKHLNTCSCYLCKVQWKGFVYYCYICEFGLTLEDVSSLPVITAKTHEHPWTLMSRPMSFICDFCGTDGDRTPYLCTTCNLIVHKDCISLPRSIAITRHHHPIFHSYYLRGGDESDKRKCRICYKHVDTGYGSYGCSASNCSYIAHVKCATDKSIWDGKTADEWSEEEHVNLITDVTQTMCLGEDVIATEIKHAYHGHNLVLTFSGEAEAKDDSNNCDGCMRPISVPFYGCKQCDFCLHKDCAELFKQIRHPCHKHPLVLMENVLFESCDACNRYHHGFIYKCNTEPCKFQIDIRCNLVLDTLDHPSHDHPIFLDHKLQGNCGACSNQIQLFTSKPSLLYTCTDGCEFVLDFSCLTLPEMAQYKYDEHPLLLAYRDDSDPSQGYCDICEEERNQKQWFYVCAKCDNSVHTKCILGELPFIKLGKTLFNPNHPHPLTFVKKIWNCPRCSLCNKLCYGQALECMDEHVFIGEIGTCENLTAKNMENSIPMIIAKAMQKLRNFSNLELFSARGINFQELEEALTIIQLDAETKQAVDVDFDAALRHWLAVLEAVLTDMDEHLISVRRKKKKMYVVMSRYVNGIRFTA